MHYFKLNKIIVYNRDYIIIWLLKKNRNRKTFISFFVQNKSIDYYSINIFLNIKCFNIFNIQFL